ncbi:MAG: hypothetical protein ABH811_02795 [archaeon]
MKGKRVRLGEPYNVLAEIVSEFDKTVRVKLLEPCSDGHFHYSRYYEFMIPKDYSEFSRVKK